MSRYEAVYGTDWVTLEVDEAIERAYALGVAAALGEHHSQELEALRGVADSAYERSVVDLAYDEGRTAGRKADPDDASSVWSTLVEEGEVSVDAPESPTGGRQGLPEAMERTEVLDRVDLDHRDAVDLPEFLQKD